ncbi:EF-P lysine aminoacylase EpmA [Psychrobacter sanguinis]|uniref:EF-P lysine aminoacylase EpmA n=1 Tax=Psychrobacter sanguinis TaxID=861445 RepID=UPI00020C7F49|nr:EF-P lysine aminoacylase EpmA [Psychrobacter sanguinis]EGK07526.1 lysine--tRNA ligase [Psychrobacter sp. 1501(2011)]MCC3309266.1 EF-P lysine aminoacylase GenX [Psychrobacter sanguinis]MCD9151974.1 EF-P lysine aminoacylase GenX [Psychrobacter sanguinis]MDY3307641.1 EF-P lysine aminoacylase EpmA [Psychrobacter sanguinis]UEC26541.1 EF-P lysine aminoacylase GenX [Psychrobacter sanguinis]
MSNSNPANCCDYHPSMSLKMAHKRAQMLTQIRQFFAERQVLEVQTPLMSKAGNTDVFVPSISTNVTVQDKPQTHYLHTSPEFAMKRMLASWKVAIYQICPVFRDNEVGSRHNSEFTMLEWYRPGFDLEALAAELSDLLTTVYGQSQNLTYYSYSKAFIDYVGIHPLTASLETIKAAAEKNALGGLDLGEDRQGWLDVLFSHLVEPNLGYQSPTLITDYPPATAALAKVETDEQGNEVAKRFELYINGIEIANAYDELADGAALQARFEADNEERARRGLPIMPIDERLVAACDHLPACSGIALGIDRLLMVVTGAKSIDEVIGFGIGRA